MPFNKQQRKAIYAYLAKTGYIFNKERHKMLKKFLQSDQAPEAPPSKESEGDYFDDNDPQLEDE